MTSAVRHKLYLSAQPLQRHALARRWASTHTLRTAALQSSLTCQRRGLADVRNDQIGQGVFFTGTTSAPGPLDGCDDKKPPDERTLKLGKSTDYLIHLIENTVTDFVL